MRATKKRKYGFSLMELLISIGIFMLAILGITYLAFISYRYYNFVFNQAEIVSAIQKSINTMSKEIREMRQADSGAFDIEEATDNEIIFYSDINGSPEVERVKYFINGNCLKKGVIEPTDTPPRYPETNETQSDISCNITNNSDEPIFSYYSGYPSEDSLLPSPVDSHKVKVVQIYLRVSSTGKIPLPVSKVISIYTTPRNINQEE